MKARITLVVFGVLIVVSLLGVTQLAAQTCGLKIVAVQADRSAASVVTFPVEGKVLIDYSAYAVNANTHSKYSSIRSDGTRYFDKIPAGEYRIFVAKPEFKTTIQSAKLSCKDPRTPVTGYVKLWKGNPSENVEVTETAHLVREMRLDRLVRLDSMVIDSSEDDSASPRLNSKGMVSGGVLNGKALSLAKPDYPPAARAERASGTVSVAVVVDESGSVISASAVSGPHSLWQASAAAARVSKFSPTLVGGKPVKVSGVIVYNFIP